MGASDVYKGQGRECPNKKAGSGPKAPPGATGKQQDGRVNALEKLFAVKDEKGGDVDVNGFKTKKGKPKPVHADMFDRDWKIECQDGFSSFVQPESISSNDREPEATATKSHQAPPSPNLPHHAPHVASRNVGGDTCRRSYPRGGDLCKRGSQPTC